MSEQAKTIKVNIKTSIEEKNYWLGKLAYSALIALKLSQWEGKTSRHVASENLFLLRWLQTALKQKRFHRCLADDFTWLIQLAQQRLITTKLKSRLEFMWRSCCCDLQTQSHLFKLTYAIELLKDLGWDNVILNQDVGDKWINNKGMTSVIPIFYIIRTVLETGFDANGTFMNTLTFWVFGDRSQFETVMTQHGFVGKFIVGSPCYLLTGIIS